VTDRELIEAAVWREGYTVERWDEEHENGLTAFVKGRFRVVEGNDDVGLYEGDEGTLNACVVGSEQYRNRRVAWGLLVDEYDSNTDVDDLTVLEQL
jgi:hypothetical protein